MSLLKPHIGQKFWNLLFSLSRAFSKSIPFCPMLVNQRFSAPIPAAPIESCWYGCILYIGGESSINKWRLKDSPLMPFPLLAYSKWIFCHKQLCKISMRNMKQLSVSCFIELCSQLMLQDQSRILHSSISTDGSIFAQCYFRVEIKLLLLTYRI